MLKLLWAIIYELLHEETLKRKCKQPTHLTTGGEADKCGWWWASDVFPLIKIEPSIDPIIKILIFCKTFTDEQILAMTLFLHIEVFG